MTQPVQHEHYSVASEPSLNGGKRRDGQPDINPGDNFIFCWHNSLSNPSNIVPTG